MSIEEFNQILNDSPYNNELKEKLREFFGLLNEDGQQYLADNLQSIIEKPSA